MNTVERLLAWGTRFVLAIMIVLSVGCGKSSEPSGDGLATKPAVKKEHVRTTLEVWCDEPIVLSFWGCSWRGVLSYDGKTYGAENTISLMRDLGKQETSGTYYKTELMATGSDYLFVNLWISLPKNSTPHSFNVTLKSRTYVNGRLDEECNVDKKDFKVGLLGQGFQIGKSIKINS